MLGLGAPSWSFGADPLPLWFVPGSASRLTRDKENPVEPIRSASPVFVGRDVEMAELAAGLEDAIGGRGRLFLITGEPGIGKTVLAEQLAAHARARGVRVLWGRCWEGGGAPAYWPWTQLLRPLIEEQSEPTGADMASDAVDLASLFPELTERPVPDPSTQSAAARFGLFAAVAALLKRASSFQPLLLLLDDFHAADPASLLLLRFVVRGIRAQRLLVVATYREVEAESQADLAEALGDLVREAPSVHLRGLARTEVRQFMQSLTGVTASEDDLEDIYDATGGNPLFIRELVRLGGSDNRLAPRGRQAISSGVRAVIHQRLASLDATTVQVLSVAAVVGQDFEVPLVEQVSAFGLPDILQALARAERSELVKSVLDPPTAFRFSHGLVREVLYDDLPIAVRRELHGKVGAAIEGLSEGDLTSRLAQLAYHYAEVAGRDAAGKAVEYAHRTGDQAMESHAYEEAADQYHRALEALRFAAPNEALRCELLLSLGSAQARAGGYQEAKGSFLRAAEIARRLRVPEQLARAALGFGEPQVEGGLVDQQLLTLLREALDVLGPDDSSLRARVLARFSLELTFSDEHGLRETVRDSLSRQALEMARRLGDVAALAIACRARWMALWGPDGLEERLALSDEILTLARETGDREMELVGRARKITCSMESGDLRAVEADIAAHARLAGELHMPYHEWTAATLRAGQTLLNGSFEVAEEMVEETPSLLPGRPNARLAYLNQLTTIRWEQGRLGELREAWQRVAERFPQAGFARGWLSLIDAELNRESDARRGLRFHVEELPERSRDGLWLPTLATASLAAAHLDDAEAASIVYPLLSPYAERAIVIPMPHPVMCFGSAFLYLALLATLMRRWEEAADHFGSAIRANTRLGASAFLVRTQYEYARMLVRRGQDVDRERAQALLHQADATARALGMAAVGREIERLREHDAGAAGGGGQPLAAVMPDAGVGGNVFRREGDYRTVAYEGHLVRLRDSKGLRLLARLLAEPGREFHVVDLEGEESQGAPGASGSGPRAGPAELEVRRDLGDAGELLDAEAKAAYRARLAELEAELNEAEGWADPERAAMAREERDFLVAELARAVGLGGRDRRAGSHAERARLNVTRAIKSALANIDRHHPVLGRHLRATIRTGTFCSYSPDPRIPVDWHL